MSSIASSAAAADPLLRTLRLSIESGDFMLTVEELINGIGVIYHENDKTQ